MPSVWKTLDHEGKKFFFDEETKRIAGEDFSYIKWEKSLVNLNEKLCVLLRSIIIYEEENKVRLKLFEGEKLIIGEDHKDSKAIELSMVLGCQLINEGERWIDSPEEAKQEETKEITQRNHNYVNTIPLENYIAKAIGNLALAEYALRASKVSIGDKT
ncbi:MAG: hypothetical protein F6K26_23910 [Moorea sp. SIO2I5]|nr:hypothetical protein [Moorena sp. SIO2I5]